jgi:hypothetical protein
MEGVAAKRRQPGHVFLNGAGSSPVCGERLRSLFFRQKAGDKLKCFYDY